MVGVGLLDSQQGPWRVAVDACAVDGIGVDPAVAVEVGVADEQLLAVGRQGQAQQSALAVDGGLIADVEHRVIGHRAAGEPAHRP